MRFLAQFCRIPIAVLCCLATACDPAGGEGPVVLAPSSMQEGVEEIGDVWTRQGHAAPILSFAGTPTLARQVAEGVPADIVLTADREWMDWLEASGHLRPRTRRDVAGNTLVLVAPVANVQTDQGGDADPRARLLNFADRLAVADPDGVPAGRYAMAALRHFGLADRLEGRIVHTENVRAALALVERGEAELGIVYATDAAASDRVAVVAAFPSNSHPPIRYPMAVLARSDDDAAEALVGFIASPPGRAILARHGFPEAE